MKLLCLIDEIREVISEKKYLEEIHLVCDAFASSATEGIGSKKKTICKANGDGKSWRIPFRKIGRTRMSGKICASNFISGL